MHERDQGLYLASSSPAEDQVLKKIRSLMMDERHVSDLLRSLWAVWKNGSYKGAAEDARCHHSTVKRHVDELEKIWGCPLTIKSASNFADISGVKLTEAGIELGGVLSRHYFNV